MICSFIGAISFFVFFGTWKMVARGYKGVCDKDGCDFNSWRLGDQKFYGRGATEFKVDSRKSLTVVTQFLTEGAGAC